MKLGTQTGSLINHLMSSSPARLPAVGDAATLTSWSDRYPATVFTVDATKAKPVVTVAYDDYEMVGGSIQSEDQVYEYATNFKNSKVHFRLEGDKWVQVVKGESGRWRKVGGYGVYFGRRNAYRDPSF